MQEETDLSQSTDLFTAPAPAANGTSNARPDPSRVLARVDGDEITQGEMMNEMNMIAQQFRGQVPPERLAQMQDEMAQRAMNNLVLKRILIHQVDKDNVQVDEATIDEAIEKYRAQIPAPATLDEQLAQVGLTMEAFRKNVATELRVNKLLELHAGDLPDATDEEIQAFYDENKDKLFSEPERVSAKHILIASKPDDPAEERAEKREQIEKIRAKLLAGADFSEMAKAESSCPSAAQGGDLGTFSKGQMVPPFEAAAFSQEVGAIGDIVETDFGFHIIQVTDHEQPSIVPLEEQSERIGQYLVGQKREKVLKAYIDTLREAADIEVIPAS